MVKEIPLTKCKVALVDDELLKYLNQWKWHDHNVDYAVRSSYSHYRKEEEGSRYKNVFTHNFIISVPEGMRPNHIDGNGLRNTRDNLRLVTPAQNNWNTKRLQDQWPYQPVYLPASQA